MAYNPSLYNPYGPQQFQPTAGYSQQYQSTFAPQQPVNGLVSVTGIEGAKAYQLPPNSSMPLFDKDNDIMYLKTTDGAGFPTIRQFRFEAVEAEQKPVVEYVPRSEFDALAQRVKELTDAKQPVQPE